MSAVFENQKGKLDLHEVLSSLELAGIVSKDNAHMLRTVAVGSEYTEKHPFIVIADRNWLDDRDHLSAVTIEFLSLWLAEKCALPYHRIDPLKIEVSVVTRVVSYAYAARYNILPIKVTAEKITVATAEPYEKEWQAELSRINNKQFECVISNPVDIARYLLEFYSVSKSVLGAQKQSTEGASNIWQPGIADGIRSSRQTRCKRSACGQYC